MFVRLLLSALLAAVSFGAPARAVVDIEPAPIEAPVESVSEAEPDDVQAMLPLRLAERGSAVRPGTSAILARGLERALPPLPPPER